MPLSRTLIIIKPGYILQNNLVGEVMNILEKSGLKIVGIKMLHLTTQQVQDFYHEHRERPFFASLVSFMCSLPVIVICLEGKEAVNIVRKIIGTTNPQTAALGTIRRIYGENIEANAIHGSDSETAAAREIKFFFKESELF